MSAALTTIDLPALAELGREPVLPASIYEGRIAEARARMARDGLDALLVYGDREHFANISYLCGFDPRFEEAVAILTADGLAVATGNEAISMVADLPVPARAILCQSFSLPGQNRLVQAPFAAALGEAGVGPGALVGLAGWKPLAAIDVSVPGTAVAAPQFLTAELDHYLAEPWVDATELLCGLDGMRALCEADQLALHEHRAARASQHVWRALEALAPGRSEREVAAEMGLNGLETSCHVMCTSGADSVNGLYSPTDREIGEGDFVSIAVGLRGGLCSRTGRAVAADHPDVAATVERFHAPYIGAQKAWYEAVTIGADPAAITADTTARLAEFGSRPLLNPGHLTHLDEWTHSPFAPGVIAPLRSGTALQCDIIPVGSERTDIANCEDGLALADADLRAELAERFPEAWARIEARRAFMAEALGIELSAEVLPFCERQGAMPAALLSPSEIVVAA
jgi:Xaa-Pro aminopeptidase